MKNGPAAFFYQKLAVNIKPEIFYNLLGSQGLAWLSVFVVL